MKEWILLVVVVCVSYSIAQSTGVVGVGSGSTLNYTQTAGVLWETQTGACYINTSNEFLRSSLSAGQQSSVITISGWNVTYVQKPVIPIYMITLTVIHNETGTPGAFYVPQLSFACGQSMTNSLPTIGFPSNSISFTWNVNTFNASEIEGFTLKLERNASNSGPNNLTISCIRLSFAYNDALPITVIPCAPTPSPSPSPVSPSTTPSRTTTPSPSVTPTNTPTASITATVSPTASISATVTPSISVSPSSTPSSSVTPSITCSPSVTPTVTPSISVSPTVTPSISVSPSITPSPHHGGSNKSGSKGTIIGAAVGSVVGGVALCGLVAFFVVRKQRASKRDEDKNSLEMSRSANNSGSSSAYGYAPYSTNGSDTKPLTKKGTMRGELYVDDVKLKGLLGRGKFGEVYEGIWHGSTPVACKRLKKEDETEFENEIRLLTMLNHPNVVRCLGIWLEPHSQETYMVLELLRLGSLADFLRKKEVQAKLTVKDLIEMCANIASGMIYLEQKNIVHRDLGSRNLLITETDGKYVVKVSDFGLSRQVDDSDAVYSSKEGVFPIKWSPPEVINYRKFTSKSDVWSFGVTMWEVFEFGKVPYPSMTNQQCMDEVMNGYRLPQPLNCPDKVYACMRACWLEDPEGRPNFKSIHESLLNVLEQMKAPEEPVFNINDNNGRNSLYNTDSSYQRKPHQTDEIYNSRLFEN